MAIFAKAILKMKKSSQNNYLWVTTDICIGSKFTFVVVQMPLADQRMNMGVLQSSKKVFFTHQTENANFGILGNLLLFLPFLRKRRIKRMQDFFLCLWTFWSLKCIMLGTFRPNLGVSTIKLTWECSILWIWVNFIKFCVKIKPLTEKN